MNDIDNENCIFCNLNNNSICMDCSNAGFYVMYDNFPVSKGHVLIISKRHVATYFDLTHEEKKDLLIVIDMAKSMLDELYSPDGYNIGCNCGEAAGQTINHFHMHIIPRYKGDMDNPEGGIRGVIPHKQKYSRYT
jgi:diadenosine tetraphosphate (Ap4A) HIT family hydrolase